MSLGLTLGSGAGIGAAVGKDDMNAAVRDPRFMEREELAWLLRRADEPRRGQDAADGAKV